MGQRNQRKDTDRSALLIFDPTCLTPWIGSAFGACRQTPFLLLPETMAWWFYYWRPLIPADRSASTGNPLTPALASGRIGEKGIAMARYITLLRFTEQGAKNIKKSTTRAHDFDNLAAKAGVKVEGQYWTVGSCDGVLILNAADEQPMLHLLTELAALGNVHTETMKALTDKEFGAIVGK